MCQSQEYLADQHAAEITVDSEKRDTCYNKDKPQEHGGNTLQKGGAGAAQAV